MVCFFLFLRGVGGGLCQNSPFLYEFFDINESTESGIGETVHL